MNKRPLTQKPDQTSESLSPSRPNGRRPVPLTDRGTLPAASTSPAQRVPPEAAADQESDPEPVMTASQSPGVAAPLSGADAPATTSSSMTEAAVGEQPVSFRETETDPWVPDQSTNTARSTPETEEPSPASSEAPTPHQTPDRRVPSHESAPRVETEIPPQAGPTASPQTVPQAETRGPRAEQPSTTSPATTPRSGARPALRQAGLKQVVGQIKETFDTARDVFDTQMSRLGHSLEYGDLIYVLRETADRNIHRLPPEVVVPNAYEIRLNPAEFAHISPLLRRYEARLSADLVKHIVSQGYTYNDDCDRLEVVVQEVPDQKRRVEVTAAFKPIAPLALLTGPVGETVPLYSGDRIIIGRGEQVDWYIEDHNERPVASRVHCTVTGAADGSHVTVQDTNSKNGTYVNGERVTRVTLTEDGTIRLGRNLADEEGPAIHVHLISQEAGA